MSSPTEDGSLELWLHNLAAEVLNIDLEDLDPSKSFLALGGDSLSAIEFMGKCRNHQVTIEISDVITATTLSQLIERIVQAQTIDTTSIEPEALLSGAEDRNSADEGQSSQTIGLKLNYYIPASNVKFALETLVHRHKILQSRVEQNNGVTSSSNPLTNGNTLPLLFEEVIGGVQEAEAVAVDGLRTSLDLEHGAVFGAVLCSPHEQTQTLILVAHSAVIDQTSWRIIIRDLSAALQDTVGSWPSSDVDLASLISMTEPSSINNSIPLLRGFGNRKDVDVTTPPGNVTRGSWESNDVTVSLDESTTEMILRGNCHKVLRTTATDIVNAALLLVVYELGLANSNTFVTHVINRRHDHPELLDTVGCFDETVSFEVEPPAKQEGLQMLRNVKDVAKRSTGKQGILRSLDGMGRNITTDKSTPPYSLHMEVQSTDTLQISQLGVSDLEVLPPIGWMSLPSSSAAIEARDYVQVLIYVWNGKLNLSFRGSTLRDHPNGGDFASTAQQKIASLLEELNKAPRLATFSDFPLLDSSYTALDTLFAKLQTITPDPVAAVQAIGPCSPMQNNFLISQKLNPRAYQCRFTLRITSATSDPAFNPEALMACWTRVMSRHAILRTTFIESDTRLGKFDQVVWKYIEPWVTIYQDANAVLDDNQFPTYATYQPPHRLSIVSAPGGGIYVKLDISHALVDGQSTEVLLRDFSHAYNGTLSKVEALPYLKFTEYELGIDTGPTSAYWSKYMDNAQESHLPVSNSISASGLQDIQAQMNLPPGQLDSFCGQYGITPVNVCQVAWGLVLRSFTSLEDVCFSYVTSRRQTPLSGIQDAVGLFIDALFCRLHLKGDTPIREVLSLVGEDFTHSLPYQNITAALSNDPKGTSVRQWGNSVLSFHRAGTANQHTKADLSIETIERTAPTDYDVSLNIDIDRDSLIINLDFWESKMNRPVAESILIVFQEAIKFVLQDAHEPVQAFSPLTGPNKDDLRRQCELDFPRSDVCIHELVQAISAQQPHAPAVCAWDGDWTYEELVSSAAVLSQELVIKENLKPGTIVGICMGKSKWAVAAMLAVLMSGAAVLPIGIDDPRAEELLKSADVTLVLTGPKLAERFRDMDLQALVVGARTLTNLPAGDTAVGPSIAPNSAAWLLYTSGSSGKPKGVVLEHSALSTALLAQGKAFHIGPGVRTLQFAAYTFADSITDIFGTLVMGGCVCVPSEDERTTGLAAAMHNLGVNQATLTSTVAGLLLEPSEAPVLKRLILSGEKPSATVVSKWKAHTDVINGYGQSEAAIFASCGQPITDTKDSSNIGRPITGRFWVVQSGDYNRLCPIGAPGELLIESPALARGYLNDTERSTSAFVEDPKFLQELGLSSGAPRRMYRTGDIVRQDGPNGAFIYIGRQDTQVKIRGQRVELGEVESAIIPLLPATVSAAIVSLIRFGYQSEPKLVAALELASSPMSHGHTDIRPLDPIELPGLKENLEKLQNSLLGALPVHMVPTLFIPMTRLPVNASKKIDRRALNQLLEAMDPTQIRGLTLLDAAQQQPRTETESQLQSLWALAFNRSLESISIKEHFFQAGGDSVTAIRMVAAARNVGLTLTVADIFSHPRIEDLARVLALADDAQAVIESDPRPFELYQEKDEELPMVATQCNVDVSQIEDVYPCTPLQEGLMLVTTQRTRSDAYVMQRVYRIPNTAALAQFKSAWETLVAFTPILRTRIALSRRGGAVQVVINETVHWNGDNIASLSDYLEQSSRMPIEYGQPLSRVAIIDDHKHGDSQRYFVWTIHHSVYDGWSTLKTLDLLARLWAGEAPPPAPVPMSRFIRYLARQDEQATRQFWLHHLEGVTMARFPSLPDSLYQPLPLQKAERRVMSEAHRKGVVTTSTLLRATWAIILALYSGEREAVMMVAMSGRNAPVPGIVDLVAPTVTSVPFRVPVPQQQSLHEFLEEVQTRTTNMIPFEHTGLQHIRRHVRGLGADFDPGHVFTIQTSAESDQTPLTGKLERLGSDKDGMQSYAFTLDCITHQDRSFITLEARFDNNIISTTQVESILAQFDHIFHQLSEYSEMGSITQKVIGDLDLLSPEDKTLIRTSHQLQSTLSAEECLHHLIEEIAVHQPESVAVSAWDGDLTYSELDHLASLQAKHLIGMGVVADTAVGFSMSKSRYAIVAILAILKSGGAVVPLAVQESLHDIEDILDKAGTGSRFGSTAQPIILVDKEQATRLKSLKRTIHSVIVDEETLDNLSPITEPLSAPVGKDHIAFVVYTTGIASSKPKGVVLKHGALGLNIRSLRPLFDIGPGTRTLQFAPFKSGVAIEDIFTTLSFGGCLCVPSEHDRINDLVGFVNRFNVHVASITPSLAALFDPIDTPSLRSISIGGEITAAPVVLRKWLEHTRVQIAYSLSECGITCSYSPPLTSALEASSIGFPTIPGAFWVVQPDDYNKLCPPGAIGELLIQIPLLSPGYANDASIVEPTFLRDPKMRLSNEHAQRHFYRTGDLVRQNSDESFTLITRQANQAEIQVQRTELCEIIEYHITTHPSVQDAIVLRLAGERRGDQIVTLVTLQDFMTTTEQDSSVYELPVTNRQDTIQQISNIRDVLAQQVPKDLIPNLWIPLAAFPIDESSNQINISVLSEWVAELPSEVVEYYLKLSQKEEDDDKYTATKLEQRLRQIWSEELKLPLHEIPFNRPFLSFGGDSITAIRVVASSRTQGIKFSLRNVLQCKGISELAQNSTLADEVGGGRRETTSTENFGLLPIQELYLQRIVSNGPHEADETQFNQTIRLQLQHPVTFSELASASEAIVTKHEMLRARFYHDHSVGWQQRIEEAIAGSYTITSHHVASGEITSIIQTTQRLLDLHKGPVFAIDFFEFPGQPQTLSLVAHQAVIDKESWLIVVSDLESLLARREWSANSKSVSFHTWYRLLSQHISETPASEQTLPFDIPAAKWEYWNLNAINHTTEQMLTETVEVTQSTTSLLLGKANEALRSQPQDILLAALFHSFHLVFADRALPSVFEQGHGRKSWNEDVDLSETVGCFTTLTPLHVSLSEEDDIVATLRQTKDRRRIALKQTPFYFASQLGSNSRNDGGRDEMEITFHFDEGSYLQQDKHDTSRSSIQDLGQSIGDNVKALAVIEITAVIVADRLQIRLSFNRQSQFQDRLQRWLTVYADALQQYTQHLITLPRSATVSDFPIAKLTQADLEALALPEIGITLSEVEDILPCSPIQQGILLSQLRLPTSYRIFQTFCLRPADPKKQVDVQRLSQTWKQLQARHSIMRTLFVESLPDQDEFHQIVLKSPEANIILTACQEGQDPVQHLAELPAMQETGGREVYGKFETTHALADAASFDIFLRELLEAYDSVSFTTPGSTYGTYVSYLRQQPAEEDLQFWTTLLADMLPCALPPLHSEESVVEKEDVHDTPFTSARLDDLSSFNHFQSVHRVTMASVFELAWALILALYTGSNRVCWGGLFNGRDVPLANIDLMVGPVINQIIHFISLDFESTVSDAALDVQQRFLDAFEHQRSSLAAIQHAVKHTDQALFNTLMSVRPKHTAASMSQRSLILEPITSNDPTEYDITLHVITGDQDIEVTVQYSPTFMDSTAAKRLLDHYLEVVQSLVENPTQKLRDLTRISRSDVVQIQSWNKSLQPKMETCAHQLIQQRLQKQPDTLVVDAWDGSLTGRELDETSSGLARYLIRSAEVSPNQLVGFCMSKSKWAIVAMLGILNSGGAVVPLGVKDPLLRIESIIQRSGLRLIVADREQISRLETLKDQGVRFISVEDVCFSQLLPESSEPCSTTVTSSNIAFVMHTSGSTGIPKGVIVDHGSLCTSMKVWVETPQLGYGPDTRASQFTAFTFDPANHEILSVLYIGGCVCVPSEHDRLNNLEKFISDFRITSAILTPTVARLLDPEQVPSLRTLILTGEALKPSDVEIWLERGSAQVINAYGPTECTINVTVSRPLKAKDEASIIGYPLAVAFWITQPDDFNHLLPVGIPGELLVEGPLVATGYLHDAISTAASFIVDPAFVQHLGPQRGRRMYRTGDIVRQNHDGSLTYIGRRDEQVKVHGQRVETSEIENWILRLGANLVRVAYVGLIAPFNKSSEPRIIAAVKVNGAVSSEHQYVASPDPSILRELHKLQRSLLDVLPSYMVPSVIVPLCQMPLSSSGKINRPTIRHILCSLGEADLNSFLTTTSITPKNSPSSPTELLLQGLWATVLQKPLKSISGEDNFFQIGGDSISAMKLVAAARRSQPPISLTVANIFQHPRLSELVLITEHEISTLATVTDAAPFTLSLGPSSVRPGQIAALADQCKVAAENIEDVYPCSPLQEGLMAITTRRPDKYVLQRVFRLHGDVSFFQATWERLWESLAILRTRIVPWETGAVQVVVQEPVHWQSSSSLPDYLKEDRSVPMAYGSRLCRVSIVETPGSEIKHFVLTMHHSIYDGWSMMKTIEMLERLARNESVSPPVPMSRFISYLTARDENATQSFWQNNLSYANVIKFPELPVDPSYLPQSTQHAKRQIIRQSDNSSGSVTTSNILRAAWAILLAAYAGTDANEAMIMVALSGRQAPVKGIENILAPTVATVPVRVQIPQGDSIQAFLSRVQQDAVEMIPYEHAGLQNIRRYVPDLDEGLFTPAHLFTVQAAIESDDERPSSAGQLLSLERGDKNDDAIQGYAFNIECTMIMDKQIDVDVWFDERTISMPQVRRVLEQFENIFQQLSQFSNDENRLVRDLDLISPQDKTQIISWNETVPERTKQCIHEILQDISDRQPDAPAVCAWDGDLTYRELVDTSSRLAHHLRQLDGGVGPEALIGFAMSKSKWAIVAIVAILQAGAGVVPLGIQHPLARIQTIVESTAARFILTDREQADRLSPLGVRTVVLDDDLMNSLPEQVSGSACPSVTVDNVAWVVFTSGSTGTPKGSILEHGALASSLLKHSRMLLLTAQSRALQFAAWTFDNSISDVFATLFQGGCVCEPSEHDRVSNLAQVVWDLRVNVLSLTPTVAALLRPQDVPPIDVLIVGGEPLDPNVIDIWGKSSAIINSYGPSECSILVACSRPLVERRDAPNVGLPVACCFWVVSPTDYNQLSPIGAPGELLLQGPQLGRGYINEPEKTAQAFVMNPRWVENFPSARNQRLYRSGDLVRQNPDQSLTMLGRRDTQVKIHGQRVEIGEIESWIVRLMPDARKAAVDYIALAHGRSDRVLVAALELQKTTTETPKNAPVQVAESSTALRQMLEKLRSDLRGVLPSYMIPNIFLPVTRLPLNPSSKLDRLALRTVFATLTVDDWNRHLFNNTTLKSVETETEALLRQLWSNVLSLDEMLIGRDDNLFDLGGDSVVAMRLTARAREAGLQLTVADIFQRPVLEQMASAASKSLSAAPSLGNYQRFSLSDGQHRTALSGAIDSLPWIQTSGAKVLDIAPVTDFQAISVAGMLSSTRMDLNHIAIDGKGQYDADKLKRACLTLIDHVETLRTAFFQDGDQFWQVILSSYDPKIQTYHTNEGIDAFTKQFIGEETFGSPEQGKPPIDIAIINTDESDDHRILFRMSHALYDAHSLPLIWDTLMAIYGGTAVKPYPQFTNYLFDLHARIDDSSLSYWRKLLHGSLMPQLGRSHATQTELKAAVLPTERIELPSSVASGMMPAVVVKAAWGIVLAQHSGLLDVVFAESSTGRNAVSPAVASAYGCCVTALPFRFVMPSNGNVSDLLDIIRDQQTESIQYETVGTRRIVENCTEWNRFTSLINHQRAQESGFVLGETEYTSAFVTPTEGFYMMTDITIAVTQGSGWLEMGLGYAVDVVPKDLATSLFHDLRVAIEAIASSTDASVSSIAETQHVVQKIAFQSWNDDGNDDDDEQRDQLEAVEDSGSPSPRLQQPEQPRDQPRRWLQSSHSQLASLHEDQSEPITTQFIRLQRQLLIRRRRSLSALFQTVKSKYSRDRLNTIATESEQSTRSALFPRKATREIMSIPMQAKQSNPPRLDVPNGLPKDGLHRSSTFRASIEKAVDNINDKYGTTSIGTLDRKVAKVDKKVYKANLKPVKSAIERSSDGSTTLFLNDSSMALPASDGTINERDQHVDEHKRGPAINSSTNTLLKHPPSVVESAEEAISRDNDTQSQVEVQHARSFTDESYQQTLSTIVIEAASFSTLATVEVEVCDRVCPKLQDDATQCSQRPELDISGAKLDECGQDLEDESRVVAEEEISVCKEENSHLPEASTIQAPSQVAEADHGTKLKDELLTTDKVMPRIMHDDTEFEIKIPNRKVSVGSTDTQLPSVSELVTKFRRMESVSCRQRNTMPRVRPEDCLDTVVASKLRGSNLLEVVRINLPRCTAMSSLSQIMAFNL
ncbi:Nonribosomal peptide synthetase 32 [Cladobotryum mycophilum]|uniref:Nonribosomal peptide synthetase 32 n=1 Tax=Cladobotryum mycophilum TaxID=491253 RepID=A0ABR0S9I6_9HYPO